jgi:UDP-glucose 4-epimerase
VDDVVDAFLRAGASEQASGQVFNLGGSGPVSLLDVVKTMIDVAGQGSYRLTAFPAERKIIDIGDFYADSAKIRDTLGWQPRIGLRQGLEDTIAYYRQHKEHYL